MFRNKAIKQLAIKSSDMTKIARRHSVTLAKKLLNGILVVDPWITEETEYELSNFDWNISFSKSPTTFQLFLQGLNPVMDLTSAYVYTSNKQYLHLAEKFVLSWYKYSKNTLLTKENEYIWDQHSTAIRTEAILYYLLISTENNLINKKHYLLITEILLKHGTFLADPQYYLKNENHGVFQDKALLYLAYAFNNQKWIDIAKERLLTQWNYLFTSQMACLENSFTYQRINKDLFLEIAKFLKNQGDPYGDEMINKLCLAEDFMGYALMPNGFNAPFGDSIKDDYSNCICISDDGVLSYASSKGKKGKKPINKSVVYPEAGYYFAREFWDSEDIQSKDPIFEDSIWTMFKSGYKTITHKQADDNSFILYGRGEDILVDSGVYNYMFRDPIRRYVRSANAHNTIIVDETSFPFLRSDCAGLTGIAYYALDKENCYDYLIGYNCLYLGVTHFRHFIYFQEAILIYDEIKSNYQHTFSQLFHLGKNIKICAHSDEMVLAQIADSNYFVRIKQLNVNHKPSLNIINGADPNAIYGLLSENFNEYSYINTLKFDIQSQNVNFITLITIENNKEQTNDFSNYYFDFEHKKFSYISKNKTNDIFIKNIDKYDYVSSKIGALDNIKIENKDGQFEFKNEVKYNQPVEYAWYIIDNASKKTVLKKGYSSNSVFMLDFNAMEGKNYSVRAFSYNKKTKKKATQIVAHIFKEHNKWNYKRELELDSNWQNNMEIL